MKKTFHTSVRRGALHVRPSSPCLSGFLFDFARRPATGARKVRPYARILASLLFLLSLSYLSSLATLRAIDVAQPPAPAEPAAPVEDPAKPLGELVGKLSALDTLAPRDLADFATETIAYSQAVQAAKQPVSEKPIRDALDAVAQGRRLDPKAADWDNLQARLEKFLEKPEQQNQDEQQQQQQDKQNQSGDKNDRQQNQNQDQNQQQQSGQNDKQQQDQQNQSGEGNDKQQQQEQGEQGQQQDQQQQQQSGEQQQNQQDKQNDAKGGDNAREQDVKTQQQSAFGDMKNKEDDEQNSAPQPQEQQSQPQPSDMQQVGGAEGRQQQPVDSSMIMPLRQLDQVRDKDSPAVLFQRMQSAQSGTNQLPAAAQKPKGKDW